MRRAASAFLLLAFIVAWVAWPRAPRADFFSQSPGPLASAHQSLEGRDNCQACHTEGRALSNDKCLGCHDHEPIRRRIVEGKGLHASAKVAGKPCYLCHTDHKGRGKDILGFAALGGKERFDHALTGWPLDGKHARVECAKCHDKKTRAGQATYLAAPTRCDGCHAKESPHGELRASLKNCQRCHGTNSWERLPRMDFDHDNSADSRFPIEAKHQNVPCLKCHDKWRFRMATATGAAWQPDCTPCHKNVHGDSLFGKKRCALCHTAKVEWVSIRFDHARQTKFPLDGAHAKKDCKSCHAPQAKVKPDRACVSCHRDVHKGRMSAQGDCGSCHFASAWKEDFRFDHGARTRFALAGKHAEVTCRACHRGGSPSEWEKLDAKTVGCMGCHQHASVHKGQFRDDECLRCHLAPGKNRFKREAISRFHGPESRFPLLEGHARVACEKCHKNDVYQGTPIKCGPACHEDALHKGALGDACLRCHEGGHWAATRFDHDDSRFPLVGHHQEASCEGCHPSRRFVPSPRLCAECHGQDDAHQGTLGTACERCHSPTGRSLFDHNDPQAKERFRLTGKHRSVRCQACHPTTVFPTVPAACEGCHAEPAVHLGRLGKRCGDCHDTVSWAAIRTGHDAGAIKFGGAHDRLACERCHFGGQLRRGTGELCVTCHRNDDIHHGSLGPRCGDCHGQKSWTSAHARFNHERTGCDLRGLHRTLPCNDCHTGGNFAALSSQCVACHRADAIRAKQSVRAPAGHEGFTQCASCHNVNYFVPSRGAGTESVCR